MYIDSIINVPVFKIGNKSRFITPYEIKGMLMNKSLPKLTDQDLTDIGLDYEGFSQRVNLARYKYQYQLDVMKDYINGGRHNVHQVFNSIPKDLTDIGIASHILTGKNAEVFLAINSKAVYGKKEHVKLICYEDNYPSEIEYHLQFGNATVKIEVYEKIIMIKHLYVYGSTMSQMFVFIQNLFKSLNLNFEQVNINKDIIITLK